MRLYSVKTFFSSLLTPSPHKERIFGIIGDDEVDRKQIAYDLLSEIKRLIQGIEIRHFNASEVEASSFLQEMRSQDLFAKTRCLVIDRMEQWDASSISLFFSQIKTIDEHTFVLFLSESNAIKAKEVNTLKENALLLDLSKEKPWDKKKRIVERMVLKAKQNNKILPYDEAVKMVDYFGQNIAKLLSEVEKLCLLVKEKVQIHFSLEKQGESKALKTWQMVDGLIERKITRAPSYLELSDLYALLHQVRLRSYLAIAIKEENESYLKNVQLNPSFIQKYKQAYSSLSKEFFLFLLKEVYAIDLMSRTLSMKGSDLFDHLIARVQIYGR